MTIELATQQEAAFLALEAKEHVECLEVIAGYGQVMEMLWDAGCSTAEIRSSLEVN